MYCMLTDELISELKLLLAAAKEIEDKPHLIVGMVEERIVQLQERMNS